MSVAVVTTCPKCQATMHRSWTACVVCQTPTNIAGPAPLPPPREEPPRTETPTCY
jgi:hypothetical protein